MGKVVQVLKKSGITESPYVYIYYDRVINFLFIN